MDTSERKILAAAFPTPDGASRAAGAVGGAYPEKVGNTAVLRVDANEKVKFVESKDWGAGRGALVGGAIGIIGGPVGVLAGGGIGALAAKLRDSGFKNDQLEELGRSLSAESSAVVIELASDAIPVARELLKPLGAQAIVVEDLDASVASLFDADRPPAVEQTETDAPPAPAPGAPDAANG